MHENRVNFGHLLSVKLNHFNDNNEMRTRIYWKRVTSLHLNKTPKIWLHRNKEHKDFNRLENRHKFLFWCFFATVDILPSLSLSFLCCEATVNFAFLQKSILLFVLDINLQFDSHTQRDFHWNFHILGNRNSDSEIDNVSEERDSQWN